MDEMVSPSLDVVDKLRNRERQSSVKKSESKVKLVARQATG
jgi:hypothetical protein